MNTVPAHPLPRGISDKPRRCHELFPALRSSNKLHSIAVSDSPFPGWQSIRSRHSPEVCVAHPQSESILFFRSSDQGRHSRQSRMLSRQLGYQRRFFRWPLNSGIRFDNGFDALHQVTLSQTCNSLNTSLAHANALLISPCLRTPSTLSTRNPSGSATDKHPFCCSISFM